MRDLAETKKKMGQAIKSHFSSLTLPGGVSAKVSTKMLLEAKLESGADLLIACADFKGGRAPGYYGLYWIFSIGGGVIFDAMAACGLSEHPGFQPPIIFTCTSHYLGESAHFEVGPNADVDAIASAICQSIRTHAVPIIEAFDSRPNDALDYVLAGRPGSVRNPFTTCIILMHLGNRRDRLEEIIKVASTATKGFHDFKGAADPIAQIVEPLAKWFESQR
ncbi:hypothetical protein [Variovorax rhizosphaerae]|uniref:Uncharacterized protein n=1 Tax=Variovorax rhizosphaerae TaxID=1836200 RepID=A0ABU8WC05_9BURK